MDKNLEEFIIGEEAIQRSFIDNQTDAHLEAKASETLQEYHSSHERIIPYNKKISQNWGRKLVHAAAAGIIAGYISLFGVPGHKALDVKPAIAQEQQIPSDTVLTKYMNQSCEQTLKGTDVHYVNDRNYQREVFGSKTPVMVLFYNNQGVGAKGLTTLTRVLHEKFPQVKLCAYKVGDGNHNSTTKLRELQTKYPLKDTPALLFYDNDKRYINFDDGMHGGISKNNISSLKRNIKIFEEYIPKHILD